MIRLGLTSAAFPERSPDEVLAFASAAGFEGIEWAAEAHLQPGDLKAAQDLMMRTLLARLSIVSYAALYRVRPGMESGLAFDALLDTAAALHAPALRIFAGQLAYDRESAEERKRLTEELARLGDKAGERGITVCLSFARGSSLECYECARALFSDLEHSFIRLAWEDLPGGKAEEASAVVRDLTARTGLLFARKTDRLGRALPLEDDGETWSSRLADYRAGETAPKMSRFVLLGRIGDGDEARLKADAAFLRGRLDEMQPKRSGF